MTERHLFTSESVSEGHPDKIADQISDAILDAMLEQDPDARVAVETSVTTGLVLVFGEVSTTAYVNIQQIVRDTIREIGYTDGQYGFDADNCAVITAIDEQSPDIAQGVDDSLETRGGNVDPLDKIGAGDQGLMFGYATDETPEYMPLTLMLSHKLMQKIAKLRKDGTIPYLRPDAKAEVTVEYDENDKPLRVDTVVLSTQHDPEIALDQIRHDVIEQVIKAVIPAELLDDDTKYFINPTGRFVIGGPQGDAGLTGRKIIVDTYGGYAHHGGGAFSGKDPTKVDRSGAYMARYLAKNVVACGLAKRCEVALAYAIGREEPEMFEINTFGTAKADEGKIKKMIEQNVSFAVPDIIDGLGLARPIYKQTAAYGHFGKEGLPWEKVDAFESVKK